MKTVEQLRLLLHRHARCGACGTERLVTPFMKRHRDQQFTPQPGEEMDRFYCGCQNQDASDIDWF